MKQKPVVPAPDPLALLVDELGLLEKEILPLAPKLARREALRKALRDACATKSASQEVSLSGDRFVVVLGERGWEKTVSIPKVLKAIGAKAFASIATVTQKALGTLPGGIPAGVLDSAQTGPRSLTLFEKGSL